MNFEPFVSAEDAATFLGIKRRFLLQLARTGKVKAYPIGSGDVRKTWVFLLSELRESVKTSATPGKRSPQPERLYDVAIRRSSLK